MSSRKGPSTQETSQPSVEKTPENVVKPIGRPVSKKTVENPIQKEVRFDVDEKAREYSPAWRRPFDGVRPVAHDPLRPGKPLPIGEYRTSGTGDGVAYKTKAPIESKVTSEELLSKILGTDVNVSLEELLSNAPGLREELKKQISKKRVSPEESEVRQVNRVEITQFEMPFFEEESLPEVKKECYVHSSDLPRVQLLTATDVDDRLQKGAMHMSDPVLQYLDSLSAEERDLRIIVAAESQPLRVLLATVNGLGVVDCLLDQGSQIVSMSEQIAHELGLGYNPNIRVKMQSANGGISSTLGLAKNVPFKFGDIVLYLQVHILANPPYKVLLGRPFNCLTRSATKDWEDGGQTVTLECPNTDLTYCAPTYDRDKFAHVGLVREIDPTEGFQNSRN